MFNSVVVSSLKDIEDHFSLRNFLEFCSQIQAPTDGDGPVLKTFGTIVLSKIANFNYSNLRQLSDDVVALNGGQKKAKGAMFTVNHRYTVISKHLPFCNEFCRIALDIAIALLEVGANQQYPQYNCVSKFDFTICIPISSFLQLCEADSFWRLVLQPHGQFATALEANKWIKQAKESIEITVKSLKDRSIPLALLKEIRQKKADTVIGLLQLDKTFVANSYTYLFYCVYIFMTLIITYGCL